MAKLSVRQKKMISTPLVLTKADHLEIKACNNSWDNEKLKPIKEKIRKHYLKEQNKLCVYCKLPFRDDKHIEHIVPKKGKYGRPEFTFYTKNLAIACKHCNSKKSTNNDLVPWTCKPYPISGSYFKIIHPHLDDYFKHIEIVDKSRYVSKTVKGFKTIERCKLYDPTILEVLTETMQYQDDSLIQGVIRLRKLQGDFKSTINRFLDRILL